MSSIRLSVLAAAATLALAAGGARAQSPAVAPTPPPTPAPVPVPEDTGLTDQILYQYLLSEIAGQRGRTGLALRGITDLAVKTRDPRLARRAVEVAFQARELGLALEATTLWLELEPNSAPARQALAALAGSQGSLDAAKANLAAMLAQPGKAPALLMQLNALMARHTDRKAAADAVAVLAAPYDRLPEAHYAVAAARLSAKESPAALAAVDTALARRPGWTEAAVLKSQVLRATSDEAASAWLTGFLKAHPEAHDARLALARLLVAMKSYAAARTEFVRVMAARPTDPELPYAAGLLSQQMEDPAGAEAHFARVLELAPRDASPVHHNLGQVQETQGKHDAALASYRRVGPGEYFVGAQLRIGHLLAKREGREAGQRHLRDVQATLADAPETRIQMMLAEAQFLRDLKAHAEAYALLTEAVEKQPDTADLLYDRAMVAEKLDRLADMERDLKRVIELKPDHAHAYNALGYTLAERNVRLEEAHRLVQKALSLSPGDPFIQDSLGWVLFRQGKLDEALAALKQAYEQRRDPEIAAHLGEVLWARGQRQEALAVWRASLMEHPGNEVLVAVMRKFSP